MLDQVTDTGEHSPVPPETKGAPHYHALDGLRAFAVLLVLGVHASFQFVPWGWMGVQTFFVLSGFLITGILIDSKHASNRFAAFYARRVLRIAPLYYAVLAVVILLSRNGAHPRHLWMWLVYLQNLVWFAPGMAHFNDIVITHSGFAFGVIAHLWSLAVEEQFYLFWPFLVFFVPSLRRLRWVCYVLIAVRMGLVLALCRYFPDLRSEGLIYRLLPTQWDGFLLGALLAIRLREHPRKGVLPRVRHADLLALGSVAAYALLLAGLQASHRVGDVVDYRSTFQSIVGMPLCNLVSLAVLIAVLTPGSLCYRISSFPAFMSLGKVSYGFYIFHLFALVILRQYIKGDFLIPLSTALVTYAVSYLSFTYFEWPIMRLKRYFVARPAR